MVALVSLVLSDGKEITNTFGDLLWKGKKEYNFDMIMRRPAPRYIFTHLQFGLLKDAFLRSRPKVIYVMRNPFDQLVSYYHFYKMCRAFGFYTGSWDEFYNEEYKANRLYYGNFFDHVTGWWNARKDHSDHILYVKYEDMVKDPRAILCQVASFLGKELSEEVIVSILEQLAFEKMKNNPSVNKANISTFDTRISPFFRKGEVGDWKNYFTEEQIEDLEETCKSRIAPLGLHFENIKM